VNPFWISLRTALAATVLTFVLGLAAAHAVARSRSRARGLIDGILTLPLVLPPTVVGFFLLLIFGRHSAVGRALEAIGLTIVFSWPAAVLAATVVAFPLMYRTALGAFEQVSPDLIGAARTLGAGEWRIFTRVLIPLARPGIIAGTVLAFARALGEFGATLMIAGNIPGRTQTMPIAIFFAAEAGDLHRALLWVAATAALSLASIAALHYFGNPPRPAPHPTAPEPVTARPLPPAATPRRAALAVDIRLQCGAFALAVQFDNHARTLGLLGASGSGKSMTLRAIAGLETPAEGAIVLNGRVLFDSKAKIDLPPAARRVGVVFQNAALFPHLTVRENIGFGLPSGHGGARDRYIAEWAQRAHVEPYLDRYPAELSGGQQQRVAVARALAMNPSALLLDEPFSALDPHLRARLEEELRAVLAAYRGAVIFVTHDRNEAFRMCEELAVLSDGRVDAAGPRDRLFSDPGTLAAARVTGCRNIARMRPVDPDHIRIDEWGAILRVSAHAHGATFAGIRAHHVAITDGPAGQNTFPCEIGEIVDSPFERTVYLRLNGAALEADVPKSWTPPADPHVYLDPAHILLLR
jgi:molybdate transport system permease protein